MLRHLKFSHNDEILDISAGTGLLAEEIAIRFGPLKRLILNDPSKQMLEEAKYRMRYVKNVEFTSYFAEELAFQENSLSSVICLNAFHYYTDHPAVAAHIFRILKPDGTLYLLDWNRKGFFTLVNAVIRLWSKEHIHSRSFHELKDVMTEQGFILRKHKEWRFRWWNFCFLKCSKPK
jgi:ubiquinone/menaquinone biosynthesis C-methylase UbiE